MKLYHGTSERVARVAWEQGLQSREWQGVEEQEDRSRWQFPSGYDRIYLTDCYAAYFAMVAANDERWDDNGRWAIIEVDAEELQLFPDEDFLEQATRGHPDLPVDDDGFGPPWPELHDAGNDIHKRSKWFRDYACHFPHMAGDSLKYLGTCAVFDEVPPENITRVVLFDPTASDGNKMAASCAMDPQISLINYRVTRAKYQALIAWFLGATVTRGLVQRIRHGELMRFGSVDDFIHVPDDMVEAMKKRQIEVWER